ncbi:MAG: restriction endonuclease subunit S, partial [Thermomicrobiales bacterium]
MCSAIDRRSVWPVARLGDLLAFGPQNGLYKPSSKYGSGTPIVRIDSFQSGTFSVARSLKRLDATPAEIALYGVIESDLVINRVNSPEYLGKSALVPELMEPTVFESNMMRMRLDSGAAVPLYINQYLQTTAAKRYVGSRAKHS